MEKDMKFTTAGEWMNEREILEGINQKIDQLRNLGLTETEEYSKLINEWETLSQNIIEGEILNDEFDIT